MRPAYPIWVLLFLSLALPLFAQAPLRKTSVSIVGEAFHINDQATYPRREWRGRKIEGLLLNSRMVQGTFDDLSGRLMGLFRFSDEGRGFRRRLPKYAGELGPEQRTQARVLPPARRDHRQPTAMIFPSRASSLYQQPSS